MKKYFVAKKIIPLVAVSLLLLLSLPACAKSIVDENQDTRSRVIDLETTVALQTDVIANLNSLVRIGTVELTGSFLKVGVNGEGDYPVVFTLYGSGFQKGYLLSNRDNAKVSKEYLYSNGEVLIVIVEPVGRWQGIDIIELKLNNLVEAGGIAKYASAVYGTTNTANDIN